MMLTTKAPWADLDLPSLVDQARELTDQFFPREILFAAPSQKYYDTGGYRNERRAFRTISVTGQACALRCEHCGTKVLDGMMPARAPGALAEIGAALVDEGARGVLISGGCLDDGSVPLDRFLEDIGRLKEKGLKVLVHTGLVRREIARGLKAAGVDQILLDIIGDDRTIREVYHLDRTTEAYRESLRILREEGLSAIPHVVVGLHFGEILGEWEALRMIRDEGASQLVIVALQPLPGTGMAGVRSVSGDEVGKVLAAARIMMPGMPISLGCARPAGPEKRSMERWALRVGVQSIAYPLPETVAYAEQLGIRISYHEQCCSVLN
ncbi:radical SAM protein [Kyrpidia tusciae]|uniref:Radical SAM domain protein n=1 Tax=Kyrpidia tusciae (strain DSM 2912 / NBRC 15312 / T2) TaxID=562970 RepID=D5WTA2_KYRT2|nr:radical SAM protein [Kyrpidia tusciae]ADG07138.1 Radical SAM domain protein [Kyrpidia tusciae DSM 2912]